MGDDGAFRRETLHVGRLLFQVADRDEEGEIGVLVSRRLEPDVELALDLLPETVAPGFDDHAAAHLRVFGEIGGTHDLLIPFGEILLAGRGDRVLGGFGHETEEG